MEIFIKPTHITDYLERNAERYATKPAIIFEGRSINWSELALRAQQGASFIDQKAGKDPQKVVAILLANSIEFIEAYLSIILSGHIALLLDPAYKGLEYEAIIAQIEIEFLITDEVYAQKLGKETLSKAVMVGDIFGENSTKEFLRLPANQQIASLTFTSGTTGKPKTVPNTHSNHIWNIQACSEVWNWNSDDTLLVSLPLSHMHGVVICLSGAIYHGNTIYLQRWFDEDATLEALSSGKITMFTHAASAYVKLVQVTKDDYDLSAVRLCISGAAPLPPAIWQEFKERFGIEILETYGSSETGRIAGNRLHERVLGSPGKALPGVDLRIGSDGVVEVKSPGVFPGYYKNSAATKASLTKDGYWRTGDIGELKNGYIYLKGRDQERIRRFGYTISPRDVEWAIQQHPKINEVFVIGNQIHGEPNDQLIYFIAGDITNEELRDYAKENLLFAWRPDKIIRLEEIPRTQSGKANLRKLKEMVS